MFRCSVHDNEDLSDIQKFTYLKGQLVEEAQELIKVTTVEGASFAPAVELLEKTYGHKDRIKVAHILNLANLNAQKYYVDAFKKFYAGFESTQTAKKVEGENQTSFR